MTIHLKNKSKYSRQALSDWSQLTKIKKHSLKSIRTLLLMEATSLNLISIEEFLYQLLPRRSLVTEPEIFFWSRIKGKLEAFSILLDEDFEAKWTATLEEHIPRHGNI